MNDIYNKNKKTIKFSKVNDLPTSPDFVPVKSKEVVPYGSTTGSNHGIYPEQLLGLYQNSILHSGIIKSKILQTIGGGVSVDSGSTNYQETLDFLDNINPEDNIDSLLNKITHDYYIFNGYRLFITFSRDFSKIVRITHAPMELVRTGKRNEDGEIDMYQYSNDWFNQRTERKTFKPYDKNVANDKKEKYKIALDKGDAEAIGILSRDYTVMYIHNGYTPGRDYYPLPTYVSAIETIEAYNQIDGYFNNAIKKGISADGMLIIKGNTTAEQLDEEADKIQRAFTGSNNTGELMVVGSKDDESAPEFVPFAPRSTDGRVKQLIDETTVRTLNAHQVTSPLLLGIKTPGQLGGSGEMEEAYAIFYTTAIQPHQLILQNNINSLLSYNDMNPITINKLEIIKNKEE